MNVFLTGGTGFIGSHLINFLHTQDINVIALKRSGSSRPRIPLLKSPTWILSDIDKVSPSVFANVDVFIHLAAHSANYPYDTLENCLYWNLIAPLNAFKLAYQGGVRKFLVTGSCFEYGLSASRFDFVPADAPLLPIHTYPASKAAASTAFIQWAYEQKISLSIMRLFQIYGPGELETRLWPSLMAAAADGADMAMTQGDQIRDFMHVTQAASAICDELTELNLSANRIKVANLGSGNPQSIREFSNHIWAQNNATGKLLVGKIPYRENEIMKFIPDLTPLYL